MLSKMPVNLVVKRLIIYCIIKQLLENNRNQFDSEKICVNQSYDNAGNRFIKKTNTETSVYLRHGQIAVAMDIELSVDTSIDKAKINRYVLSGDLLAGRITTTVKSDNSIVTEKFYYHLDHLNSTKCVTKQDGTLDVMYEYRAFGEELKKLGTGDAKYTYGGKELDSQTNLYYFNARYYDATIGRFINVDPIQDGYNWYVYCNNNPLSFVDPTGLNRLYSLQLSLHINKMIDRAIDGLHFMAENTINSVKNFFSNIKEGEYDAGVETTVRVGGHKAGVSYSKNNGFDKTLPNPTSPSYNLDQLQSIAGSSMRIKSNDSGITGGEVHMPIYVFPNGATGQIVAGVESSKDNQLKLSLGGKVSAGEGNSVTVKGYVQASTIGDNPTIQGGDFKEGKNTQELNRLNQANKIVKGNIF